MRIEQFHWCRASGWRPSLETRSLDPDLVLSFGGPSALLEADPLAQLRRAFPRAKHFGCSTAGEIHSTNVSDESLVATAIDFEATTVEGHCVRVDDAAHSYSAGQALAASLSKPGLRHAFVLCDGLSVNGSELVNGLHSRLPPAVTVTGGLAADGPRFKRTYVVWDGVPQTGLAGILGFYGDALEVGYGSLGGWDPFGPERVITRSSGNVLYEVDGRSALALYKTYLGEHASGLPATGLLFPLSLRTREDDAGVVRTILAIDEEAQSMTFAGDIPQGAYARLMKANFDRLIDGAIGAAKRSCLGPSTQAQLALLISCVGRKLVLGQRVEEEVEGVREVLGPAAVLSGFYSYGEISPFTPSARCELHNQTMTITTFAESAS